MTSNEISDFVLSSFSGLKVVDAWGEKSFFYNPYNLLKRGVYFCTVKEKDGANDKASELERDNIFRVNFGLSKKTFLKIFPILPKRSTKGNTIDGPYDFRTLDVLTPHPIYGWMTWVSILNPSHYSFEMLKELINESYEIACDKYLAKMTKAHGSVQKTVSN